MPRHASRQARGKGRAGGAPRRQPPAASGFPPRADRLLSLRNAAILLGALCALAYWNGLGGPFVLDARPIVLDDPRLRSTDWAILQRIFTSDYWSPTAESNLYRPVSTLSFWANYTLLGNASRPLGYHLVNLALHWLNAVLAFVLVRETTRRAAVAVVGAAIFAVHPLTVEAVTNVVGRCDLLATLAVTAALCLHRQHLRAESGHPWPRLAALFALSLLGASSKESAAVLPGLMLLHDLAFPAPAGGQQPASASQTVRRAWPAYASALAGLAVMLTARGLALRDTPFLGTSGLDNPLVNATILVRAMTAIKVAGYYLALFAWPARLSSDYSFAAIDVFGAGGGPDLHAWLGLAALGVVALIGASTWRRDRAVGFFLAFAGIAFLPASNLLFPIGTTMAERLTYMPLMGASAATVSAVALLLPKPLRATRLGGGVGQAMLAGVLSILVIAGLAVRTGDRNEDWQDEVRLWSSALRNAPGSFKPYKALAAASVEHATTEAAVDHAIELVTTGVQIVERAQVPLVQLPASLYEEAGSYHLKKSRLLDERGLRPAAEAELQRATDLLRRAEGIDREVNNARRARLASMGRPPSRIHDIGSPFVYMNLATAYLAQRNAPHAIDALSRLQHIDPLNVEGHYLRGLAEEAAADPEIAARDRIATDEHLRRSVESLMMALVLDPAHRPSWEALAEVSRQLWPARSAVLLVDGQSTLDVDNPEVRQHMRAAREKLLALATEAGLDEAAEALRRGTPAP